MPRKPKSPCRYPGCKMLCDETYCDQHKSKANREYNRYRRNPETNKRYGREWRRIRERYIKEHPLCEKCLEEGLIRRVEEVHHIVPLDEGGTHAFSNLMSLCKSCHSQFTLTATNSKKKYEDK